MKYIKAMSFFVVCFWVAVFLFTPWSFITLVVATVLFGKQTKKHWLGPDQTINVWAAKFLNPLLKPQYRFGHEDETLSSVVGKNLAVAEHFVIIDRWLSAGLRDDNHSEEAIEKNEGDPFIKQKVND